MGDPCNQDTRISTMERRYESLLESIKKMEDKFDGKLDLILFQVNKVAVLEEKHTSQSQALGRAFQKIETLEGHIDDLSSFKNRAEGMARMAFVLWSALGISVGAIAVKVLS